MSSFHSSLAPFTRARVGSQAGAARFAIRIFFSAYTNLGGLLWQLLNPAWVSLLTRVGYCSHVNDLREYTGEELTLCGGLATSKRLHDPGLS